MTSPLAALLKNLMAQSAAAGTGMAMLPEDAEAAEWSKMLKGALGMEAEVLKNPTRKELTNLAEEDLYNMAKVGRNHDTDDFYAWHGNAPIHHDEVEAAFMDNAMYPERGIFELNNGKLINAVDDAVDEDLPYTIKDLKQLFRSYGIQAGGAGAMLAQPEPAAASIPERYFSAVHDSAQNQVDDAFAELRAAFGDEGSTLQRLGHGAIGALSLFGVPETAVLEPIANTVPPAEEPRNYYINSKIGNY